MSDYICLYQWVSHSIFTVSAITFLTPTANIPILITVILQHIIICAAHYFGHTALPLKITFGEMCCHAIMIHWWESHWTLWFFQVRSKHGPLPRATHCTAALGDFWRDNSPQDLGHAVVNLSLPGMTPTSVFIEQPVIVAFISGVP